MTTDLAAAPQPTLRINADRDHTQLAHMLGRITANGCTVELPARDCTKCTPATTEACRVTLTEVAMEFMVFLIEHQRQEDRMMAQLPRTHANQSHCVRHRDAHVEFTSRYNKLIWRFDHLPPSDNIRTLETLICDWIRDHALDFDSRLIRLIEDAHDRR